jgi:hypothetical protein
LCYEAFVDETLDENAIRERIRARLRTGAPARPPADVDVSPGGIETDVSVLQGAQDIYALPLRSQRAAIGPALAAANRLLRKVLKPSLERQVSYNAANERIVRALLAEVESLRRAQAALLHRCEALEAQVAALRDAKRG